MEQGSGKRLDPVFEGIMTEFFSTQAKVSKANGKLEEQLNKERRKEENDGKAD